MTYYYMSSMLKKAETLIEFQKQTDRLFDFFLLDSINGDFLNHIKLKGFSQEDMNEEDLEKCDFLRGVINIPIFSERFVAQFSSLLKHEVAFYPIEIKCKERVKLFYLAKINKHLRWIDYDKSGSRILFDGTKNG